MKEDVNAQDETSEMTSDVFSEIVDPQETEEDKKFNSKSAVRTILSLTPGPLIHQVLSTGKSFLDLYFIGKGCGSHGLSVYNSTLLIPIVLSNLLCQPAMGVVVQVSALISRHEYGEAAQVIVDVFRILIPVAICLSVVFYFCLNFTLGFLEVPGDCKTEARRFVYPTLCDTPFIFIYNTLICELMSEGRSITYGVYATVRCVLNVGILDPIIANLKKCKVWMFGLAGEVATLLPGFVMLIITFVCQKNSVKPSCKMISNKFSGETPQVFKIGASALFSYFVSMLPSIFMQKYLFKAATSINQISKYSICLGPINLLRNMENAWVIGTMTGLGPASSYAYSKKRLTRYRDLFFASFTLPFLILIINIIIYAKPKLLFSLFIKDADIISDIHRFIKTPFILNWMYPVAIGAQHMLNAMKRPLIAVIPSIATSLTIVASVLGFYYTNKTDPNRILWAFPIADGCMFIVSALCLIFPFREIKNAKKEMSSSLTQSLI